MNLDLLLEIKEYAAYGLYEALEKPYPFAYAHALRRLYELEPVRILEDYLLVPAEPFYYSPTSYGDAMNEGARSQARGLAPGESGAHHAHNAIFGQFHSSGLGVYWDVAERKKEQYPQYAESIDALCRDLEKKCESRSGYMHNNPDTVTVVRKGFLYMMQELEDEIRKANEEQDAEGLNYLYAMQDYAQGVVAYYKKHLDALREAVSCASGDRKRKLAVILDGFENCFMKPADSFVSGLLAVNLCWMLDGCDSIGRLDYVLGDLLEKDLSAGKVDLALVRELLDNLWDLFERYNGWNLQLGGRTPEGTDCYNTLTKECILCNTRNKTRRPNLALRVTRNMPRDIWELALDSVAAGNGKPALYNDELYMDALHQYFPEVEEKDLAMYGFGGCTETMLTGISAVDSLGADMNLAECLMAALFNGRNVYTGHPCGLETGSFEEMETFEEFVAAVKKQIDYSVSQMANGIQEHSPCGGSRESKKNIGDPRIVRSMFTRGCTVKRKPFDLGGAKYNWSVVSFHGTTVLADSMAAIRQCVFEERSISKQTLLEALKQDFKGYEQVQSILKKADKFGNDIPWVDRLAGELVGYTWEKTLAQPFPRGGRLVPSVILFATYENAGRYVSALPNGRNAGKPLNDSIGAFEGADTHGPTALINSVLKLPHTKAVGTPVFNMRFSKSLFAQEKGRISLQMLLKSYFQQGGLQAQISVLSTEEMRAAQKEPEKYKDLIVRIGGYSEFFVHLTEELQETVIKRAEMLVG